MKSKKQMQPLSYQQHRTSCWVTSMMNGLLVLHPSKDKIPTLAYRLLHTILTNEGVLSTGSSKHEWKVVLNAVSEITGLSIKNYFAEEVEPAISGLKFDKQVAVCDTESGGHSLLLTGRNDKFLEGFDPDWDNVRNGESISEKYETYPVSLMGAQSWINFRVNLSHYNAVAKGMRTTLRMGAVPSRILTVIDRQYRE